MISHVINVAWAWERVCVCVCGDRQVAVSKSSLFKTCTENGPHIDQIVE